jgi:uncharacterized membrane protein YqjE
MALGTTEVDMREVWKSEPSLGELFSDLTRETKQLVTNEIQLAKLELKENATRMGKGAALIGVAAVLLFAANLAVLAALVALLSTFMPVWAAAITVALLFGVVALVLVKKGINIVKQSQLAPRETIESVRKDVLWLKKRA